MSLIITQISQAVKNSERVNIFLNNKFWLGLSKGNLIAQRLYKGLEITEDEKLKIESSATDSNLINKALYFMKVRPRSCKEVRDYLIYNKRIPVEDSDNVIEHLKGKGLLSDETFAKWYSNIKLSGGNYGANKLKIDLMKIGISKEIINNLLQELNSDTEFTDNQTQLIKDYIAKASSTIKAKNPYEFKAKLVQRLLSRGFKYEDIKKVLLA